MFKTLDESYKSRVKVGNEEFLEVKGKGSVNVQTSSGIKIIPDVLFIPEISQNLLSVGQMMEKNYSLQFKDHKCTIFDPSGEQVFCINMKNRSFVVDWDKVSNHAYMSATQDVSNL
jgi:hypothetical protein